MKIFQHTALVLSIASASAFWLRAEDGKDEDLKLLAAVRARAAGKITEKPHFLPDRIAELCAPPTVDRRNQNATDPHLKAWIQVYAANVTAAQLADTEKKLPPGAVVIKEKFHSEKNIYGAKASELPEGAKPELFTVMIKRAEGFNPVAGDWEYAVVNGDASRVLARGKIESCNECHRIKKDADFLYRTYLKK